MSIDARKNFATSFVAVGPSPAGSGLSLTLIAGGAALMPATPFNATCWPPGVPPLAENAEIVRVSNITGSVVTLSARAQEETSAREIVAGWQFADMLTAGTIEQLAEAISAVSGGVIGEDPTTKAPAVGAGSVPLLSSVVNSSTAARGQTPVPNGSGAYAWETGVGGAIDIRQLVEGVKQEAEIAKALNKALTQVPPGSRIFFPPLANPVALAGGSPSSVAVRNATVYILEEAIQVLTELTLFGPGMGNGRVFLRAKKEWSDHQLVRNWQASDWQEGRTDASCGVTHSSTTVTDVNCTSSDVGKLVRDARASTPGGLGFLFGIQPGSTIVTVNPGVSFTMSKSYTGATGTISCMVGEPDHWIAPIKTAIYVLYPHIHDLGFDPYGNKQTTCIGRVHPEEQAYLARVVYRSYGGTTEGSENYGRTDFSNNDTEGGEISGVQVCEGEVSYGRGWASMILQDGTCGGKKKPFYPAGAALTRDTTTPVSTTIGENHFSSSPLKFISLSHLRVGPIHQEAHPPESGATTAFSDGTMTGTSVIKTAGSIIFTGHYVGRTISDSEGHIPAGTIFTRYISTTEMELSNVATFASGDVLTIGPDDACLRIMDCSGVHIDTSFIVTHYATKRPWLRQTSSERNPEREPMAPPTIRSLRIVTNPTEGYVWEPGAPIIEDYSDDEILRRLVATSEVFDPRVIQDYNGEEITWWDGATATSRKARLKPRVIPDGEMWTPARQGFFAANGDIGSLPGSVIFAPLANPNVHVGQLILSWIPTPWNLKMSEVWWYTKTNEENTFTTNENFIGIYTAAGALIAQTKDLSASWGAAGNHSSALEHPLWHNIGPGVAPLGGGVWMAFLINGTLSSTTKKGFELSAVSVSGYPDAGPSLSGKPAFFRAGTYGAEKEFTALPSSITPANIEHISQLPFGAIA